MMILNLCWMNGNVLVFLFFLSVLTSSVSARFALLMICMVVLCLLLMLWVL